MISESSVRYEKLRTSDIYEDQDSDKENLEEEGEEEEVTVFIAQTSSWQGSAGQLHRSTRVRLSVALLLLGLALAFIICERQGCLSETDGPRGSVPAAGHPGTAPKQDGHSHHHHDEDHDEDHEGEDHDHHGDSEHHEHQHPEGIYHHGVVITDSAVCSGLGKEILEHGGNVVDAGLAALLCLGVVHPHVTGVGGKFSAILYNSTTGTHKAIRSISPGLPPATYGIPASLQGIGQLHSLFGHCEWEKLFSGATKIAKDGFYVDRSLAVAIMNNQKKILESNLCGLFCEGEGGVKVVGSRVTNQKLAELLQFVSLNRSGFPDNLALKLAEDLPQTEREGFAEKVRQCRVEINDSLIIEEEEYSVYGAASPQSSKIISDVLGRAREQNLPYWNNADLTSNASAYISLLTAAKLIYDKNLVKGNLSAGRLPTLNPTGSHIGVLDGSGNILIISSSLNSPFGSKRQLPSTGVILSDVIPSPSDDVLQWSCPLIVKLKHDHGDDDEDDDDDDDEVLAVGVTGGLSAPFVAAQIILGKVRGEKSAQDAVTGPLLHLVPGSSGSLSGCISVVTDQTDVYWRLLESEGRLQGAVGCPGSTLALILQGHAGHVGAYGAPASVAYADGY